LQVRIFFSAHGVPLAYVEEAGDPYKAEMEECIDLIMEELEKRGITNPCTLAYQVSAALSLIIVPNMVVILLLMVTLAVNAQSRVGPVEWLKPYTDETIIELGQKGVKSLLAVPIRYYFSEFGI
jgi:protoporphyrin/coproporphyrin ferrochelatase